MRISRIMYICQEDGGSAPDTDEASYLLALTHSRRLIGQLDPAAPARIKIRQQQAESFWAEADGLGRFAPAPLQGGALSLICLRSGLPAAVTEWIAVG